MRGYMARVKTGAPGITTLDSLDTRNLLSSVDALVSPRATIIVDGALHGRPVPCFLPEEDDKTSHCAFTLTLTRFAYFLAEPSFLIARGDCSLVPAVRSQPDAIGGERFVLTLRPTRSHFVPNFDCAYDQRLLEFIENAAARAQPFQESRRSQS